jgi:hypothetical protein
MVARAGEIGPALSERLILRQVGVGWVILAIGRTSIGGRAGDRKAVRNPY